MKKINIILIIVGMLVSFSGYVHAEPSLNPEVSNQAVYPYYQLLTDGMMYLYHDYISPVNQGSCPMYPTCSAYAEQAFRKENPLLALVKTADRLHRCGKDLDNYQTILFYGVNRYNDPVDESVKFPSHKISYNLNQQFVSSNLKVREENINAKLLYEFALKLELNREYNEAIIEYKRLISYYPESAYYGEALAAVFRILYLQEKYLDAILWGKSILVRNDTAFPNMTELQYAMGAAYFRIGNYPLARDSFYTALKSADQIMQDQIAILIGLSFAQEFNFAEAIKSFQTISPDSLYYNVSNKAVLLAEEGKTLKFKDPTTATLLGIVPGLGYLYTGYPKTAFSSFAINGLMILAIIQAFNNENASLGTLLTIFEIGLYAGTVYGSYQTAVQTNEKIKHDYLARYEVNFSY